MIPALPAGALAIEPAAGARLWLLPQRAAYCPATRSLLVADAHIGKAVSFRRLGVPVPAGTTAAALARLDELLAATAAARLVFLGDLLHSARVQGAAALQALQAWRDRRPGLALILVRGNHDRRAGDPPPALGVEVVDGPLNLGPWALCHEPPDGVPPLPPGYALAGHVHPGAVLAGRGPDRLRLPCFQFGDTGGLLPAFGEFTGLHGLPRRAGERRYAVAEGRVWALDAPPDAPAGGGAGPTLAA